MDVQAQNKPLFYQAIAPPPELTSLVERFFIIDYSQKQVGQDVSNDLILPNTTTSLIFFQKGSVLRRHIDNEKNQPDILLDDVYLFGQKTKGVLYQNPDEKLMALGVNFKSTAMYQLFKIPAKELANQCVSLKGLPSSSLHQLRNSLLKLNSPDSQIDLIKNYLLNKTAETSPVKQMQHNVLLKNIVQFIRQNKGETPVQEIINRFQLSYKFLERLFNKYIGISPKTFCRIIRFSYTFSCCQKSHVQNLTHLAYSAGYYDQMHFIKEVKAISGLNPSELYQSTDKPIEQILRKHLASVCRE